MNSRSTKEARLIPSARKRRGPKPSLGRRSAAARATPAPAPEAPTAEGAHPDESPTAPAAPAVEPPAPPEPGPRPSLESLIEARVRAYVSALDGEQVRDLHALIMPELERPILRVAMELADGRLAVAAQLLGMHRNTLRARLRALGLAGDAAGR
jgi:DNA-binding protein Fis